MEKLQIQLTQIEKSGQNDFALLEEIGPSYFSTKELYYLKGQAFMMRFFFNKAQTLVIYIGICIPISLVLGFILAIVGFPTIATTSLSLIPVITLLFFIGLGLMQFPVFKKGGSDDVWNLINKELENRRVKKTLT